MKNDTKITLTIKQLRRLVKEATGDSEPVFDISGAIASGNCKFEGLNDSKRWRDSMAPVDRGRAMWGDKPRAAVGAPSQLNAKLFALCLYQKEGDGWLNLLIDFDMSHAGIKYFYSPEKVQNPWNDRRTSIRRKSDARTIDNATADDIKNNPDLIQILEDYVEYNAPGNDIKKGDMLNRWATIGKYIDSWNGTVEAWKKQYGENL